MRNLKILTVILAIAVNGFADTKPITFVGACIRGVGGGEISPTPGPMVKFDLDSSRVEKLKQEMMFRPLSYQDPHFMATAAISIKQNQTYEVSLKIQKWGAGEKFGHDVSLDNAKLGNSLQGNKLRLTRDLEDGTVIECSGIVD